jgi:NAD(P)H-hydrate repair Nnr-like enzyme with NAD(P)H-hydrate dehydratase domain
VQKNRLAAASELAQRFACTVVLKGSGTVIAAPGQTPVINPTGSARLATAGTGDVLAGMIGAALASMTGATAKKTHEQPAGKLADGSPFQSACGAVFRHGLAADQWPATTSFTAGSLPALLY